MTDTLTVAFSQLTERVADLERRMSARVREIDAVSLRINERFDLLAESLAGIDDELGIAVDDLKALTHTVNEDREAMPDPLEIEELQTSMEMIPSITQELDAIRTALTFAVRSIVAAMGEPVTADNYEELGRELAGKVVVPGLKGDPISVGLTMADEILDEDEEETEKILREEALEEIRADEEREIRQQIETEEELGPDMSVAPADENGDGDYDYGGPDDLSDDGDALASAGMGTDEDYGGVADLDDDDGLTDYDGLPSDVEPR